MTVLLRSLGVWLYLIGGAGALYSLCLGCIALAMRRSRDPVPAAGAVPPRVAVLIPAHDEAETIGTILADLRAQSAPAAGILVVADHCTDATASVAAAGGAEVLELETGGGSKGATVAAGIEHLKAREWDVLLLVDADCRVEPDFVARVDCTADEVTQAEVVLRAEQPGDRVYEFLSRLENDLFHAGRARLGLPAFVRGTGTMLGRRALGRCPWSAAGLAEDRAQGLLFLGAGVRVRYAVTAPAVWTATPRGWKQSWTQRRRWSSTSLLGGVAAAAHTARELLPRAGLRALELPLAVLADARSQWLLLLVAGVILCALSGGPARPGIILLLVTGALAAVAGFTWYGAGFLHVVRHMPRSGLVALGSATLAFLGRVPRRWQRGH